MLNLSKKYTFIGWVILILTLSACGASESTDSESSSSSGGPGPGPVLSHIPTGSALTDAMAYRFLNMATFGATPELVTKLRNEGVQKWLNTQLNASYQASSQSIVQKHIKLALEADEINYRHTYKDSNNDFILPTMAQYLADNKYVFYQTSAAERTGLSWHLSSIFDGHIADKNQVQQRVAYALSQIVVASQSVDNFFKKRPEALSYYYDFLLEHALGNYGDLLFDVSMTPAMATFLTYESNRKTYTSGGVTFTPDENYGRELMQLFSIGLYKLNIDGTEKFSGGKRIATYQQEDVNNMSRVFTGLHSPKKPFGTGIAGGADAIRPLACESSEHDSDNKTVLGQTLTGSSDCKQEVKSAVNLLMKHDNVAPFIGKKLILRLAKSNPTTEYVRRVAEAFNDNGSGVKGDLKAVVRAVLLDKELWDNIKSKKGTKVKEPYISFVAMLRAFDVKPQPKWKRQARYKSTNEDAVVHNKYYVNAEKFYTHLGQAPTFSPTVFNFFSDTFTPNSLEFKSRGFVAPELDIQTMKYLVNYNNYLYENILRYGEINAIKIQYNLDTFLDTVQNKTWRKTKVIIDQTGAYDAVKAVVGDFKDIPVWNTQNPDPRITYRKMAKVVTDWLSKRLIGQKLPDDIMTEILDNYSDPAVMKFSPNSSSYPIKRQVSLKLINAITRVIVTSDLYMIQ